MPLGGRVAFGARLYLLWVTATVSIALKMLSTCTWGKSPDPHVVLSRLLFATVPSKLAQVKH